MVARCPDVAIVGEAANGAEAIAVIERERPDLALLDLQMPEVDGLGVVRLLQPGCLPLIAFVTAFDEFAVQAFELNAVDYLLKPVEPARLAATIERARARLDRAGDGAAGGGARPRRGRGDRDAADDAAHADPGPAPRRHPAPADRAGRVVRRRGRAGPRDDAQGRALRRHARAEGHRGPARSGAVGAPRARRDRRPRRDRQGQPAAGRPLSRGADQRPGSAGQPHALARPARPVPTL